VVSGLSCDAVHVVAHGDTWATVAATHEVELMELIRAK
jgi:hypothetical protein